MQSNKFVRTGLIFCCFVILDWYAVVRLSSPWTVVKTVTLAHDSAKQTQRPITTLRGGCYNIAHGRGGKLGAKNRAGGSQAEKIARLKEIGPPRCQTICR